MQSVAGVDERGTTLLLDAAPNSAPARAEYVASMLDATVRSAVPIRTSFVQRPTGGPTSNRGSELAKLVATRSGVFLDAFLFIHAMASSSEPYDAAYPSQTWVRALGMNERTGLNETDGLEAAKSSWSKAVSRLVQMKLIRREPSGKRMSYVLLDESGDGSPYVRPTSDKLHGTWFSIPHAYWRDDHYRTLSTPAKAMLLVALSNNEEFILPFDRVQKWYGISVSTAKRGFTELKKKGMLSFQRRWRVDAKSPTGYTEVRLYRLEGEWSLAARRLQSARPTPSVTFTSRDPNAIAEDGSIESPTSESELTTDAD